ncbi:hypothetical protein NUW58_g5649 [Xylaria curta]|uniref:Uncharacterized protein n=1 Tax=Xylaria curta TaxID=42375 RepID=A0ACC1P331_9PEZI|nr:hypothetical protein NUW58_g5649 [Xylaria curta]
MESRLRETELALFYALSELHEGAIEHRAYAGLSIPAVGLSSPQNKSDMMEKWANLPLGDRTQVKEWFLNQRAEGSSSPAAQVNVQSRAQTYPVVTPTPRSGDRTPESHPQRQVSAFPRPPVVVECRPQSQELDTFVTTTTGPPSTPMAPVSDLNAPADGSGLSARVQTIVESHRRLYF